MELLTKNNLANHEKGDQSNREELNLNTGQMTSSRIRAKPLWMVDITYNSKIKGLVSIRWYSKYHKKIKIN